MLTLVSAFLLTACSDDSEHDGKSPVTIEAIPCAQTFVKVEPTSFSRAWQMPEGFSSYETLNGVFSNQSNLVNNDFDIFFTQADGTYNEAMFTKGLDGRWWASFKEQISSGTYYLYGYSPFINTVTASIAPNSTYSEGAVITLSNLPSVTPNDVCVVIGAKNGKASYRADGDYEVAGLAKGNFTYESTGSDNYLFLLFDHIYSAMHFRFRVDGDYAALRTIKLKRLELLAYGYNESTMRRSVNATITLKANGSDSSPIVGDIGFSTDGSSEMDPVIIFNNTDAPVTLPSGVDNNYNYLYAEFLGSFVPTAIGSFTLISTYDVYDTKGHLIRNNCVARNFLRIEDLYDRQTVTKRGWKYAVNLSIEPTYLYVLSEPDLDSPTVVVN